MKKIILLSLSVFVCLCIIQSCEKSNLQVNNLNQPSLNALQSEIGVVAYAKGFYKEGFGDQGITSLDDGLGYGMLWIVQAFHEGMGDNIFVPWGNNSYKFADNPLSVTLDDGSVVTNPIGGGQQHELQLRNSRAYGAANAFLPEWTYMYFLNNTSNVLLGLLPQVNFSGDAATKEDILKAWAYWWKGYAYCRIGSMYLGGVIADTANSTNGNFVDHNAMVAEGIKNLDLATQIIGTLSSGGTYDALMTQMIPSYMQVPGIPSPEEWMRNITTFKARTLLVNTRLKDMTADEWSSILTLTQAGLQDGDYAFGIRTDGDNSISVFDKDYGSLVGNVAGEGNTGFVSERGIQDFKLGDKRLDNNFGPLGSTVINKRGRSITFGTRWQLLAGGTENGAYTYFTGNYGEDNFYIAASYEENELMKAECLINTGRINDGLAVVDAIRNYQGAGLGAVSNTGLTLAQAQEELRKERRCALMFRGLAFYDLRRLGWADDVSKGGGRKGCVVLDGSGNVNTNATINYSYMSYWDVPQNELDFNSSSSSAELKNPE